MWPWLLSSPPSIIYKLETKEGATAHIHASSYGQRKLLIINLWTVRCGKSNLMFLVRDLGTWIPHQQSIQHELLHHYSLSDSCSITRPLQLTTTSLCTRWVPSVTLPQYQSKIHRRFIILCFLGYELMRCHWKCHLSFFIFPFSCLEGYNASLQSHLCKEDT